MNWSHSLNNIELELRIILYTVRTFSHFIHLNLVLKIPHFFYSFNCAVKIFTHRFHSFNKNTNYSLKELIDSTKTQIIHSKFVFIQKIQSYSFNKVCIQVKNWLLHRATLRDVQGSKSQLKVMKVPRKKLCFTFSSLLYL